MKDAHRQHALAVAEAIEAHGDQYDQGDWSHESCGTPSCIAGWSVAITFAPDDPAMFDLGVFGDGFIPTAAQEALGLRHRKARQMFDGDPYGMYTPEPTAAEAAAMLRNYAKTGKVRWPPRQQA